MRHRVRGDRNQSSAEPVVVSSQAIDLSRRETSGGKILKELAGRVFGLTLIGIVVLFVGTFAFKNPRLSDVSLARTSHPYYQGPLDL